MLSKEDQRRFDEIARHLRSTDPEFAARVGDRQASRRSRLLAYLTILLWAAVPPVAVAGGWFAATVIASVLIVAGVLQLKTRRY